MSEIKVALQRKFGPLPAWAWALIAGAAIYVYRTRKAIGTTDNAANLDANTPGITDNTSAGRDPLTLSPGESVYDPASGQLIGTAPEQQPGATPEPQSPITLDPGQAVYDPSTGSLLTNPKAPTKPKAKPKPKGKRKPKPKGKHQPVKPVRKPGHGKKKPRAMGKLVSTGRGKGLLSSLRRATPKARTRGASATHPSGKPRVRAKHVNTPALRQRPAAQKVVHPGTQKVGPHPASQPRAQHAPTPKRKKRRNAR